MGEISSFQIECEECLGDVLDATGHEVLDREIIGEKQACVHVKVRGADVEVWILENQVEYSMGENQFNFEVAYYRTAERTIQEFAAALRKDLAKKAAT